MDKENSESLMRFLYTTKKGIIDTNNLPKTTQISPLFLISSIFIQLSFSLLFLVLLLFAFHRARYQLRVYPQCKKQYQIQWIQQSIEYQLQKVKRESKAEITRNIQRDQYNNCHQNSSISCSNSEDSDNQIMNSEIKNQISVQSKITKSSILVECPKQKKIISFEGLDSLYQEEISTGLDLQDQNQLQAVFQSEEHIIKPNPQEDCIKKINLPIISPKQQNNIDMMVAIEQKIIRISPVFIVYVIANNTFNTSLQTNVCFFLTILSLYYGNLKPIIDETKIKKHIDKLAYLKEFKRNNKCNKQLSILSQQKINNLIKQTPFSRSSLSCRQLKIVQFIKENFYFLPVLYTCVQVIFGRFQCRNNP